MKLTEALKKSNVGVVRRASKSETVYQAVGGDLFIQPVREDSDSVKLGLDDLTANDWCAQNMTWIGSRAPKETK